MNSVSYHNILTNLNRFSMKVSTTRAPNNSRASRKHSLKDQRSSPMDLMLWGNSRSFIWTEKEGRQQEEVRHWKRKNKYWATPPGLTVHPLRDHTKPGWKPSSKDTVFSGVNASPFILSRISALHLWTFSQWTAHQNHCFFKKNGSKEEMHSKKHFLKFISVKVK